MSNDPKSPSGSTPGEPDPAELTEEELAAVAGAGIRYNFARTMLDSEVIATANDGILRKTTDD